MTAFAIITKPQRGLVRRVTAEEKHASECAHRLGVCKRDEEKARRPAKKEVCSAGPLGSGAADYEKVTSI